MLLNNEFNQFMKYLEYLEYKSKTSRFFIQRLYYILAIPFMVILSSCEKSAGISEEEYDSLTIPEKIDYIYSSFSDTNCVSRMILALPENIQDIKDGKRLPSEKFCERLDAVNKYYIHTEYNNAKTLNEYDPNYSWYDKIWDMDSLYGWYWFWGTLILLCIICGISENPYIAFLPSAFYLICGLLSFIFFVLGKPIETEPYPSTVVTSSQSYLTKPVSIKNISCNIRNVKILSE